MGTMTEWVRVLEVAAVFGAISFFWETVAHRKRESWARFWHFLALALTSLLFGMMFIFEWRVLHRDIVMLFSLGILALLVVGFRERRAIKRHS